MFGHPSLQEQLDFFSAHIGINNYKSLRFTDSQIQAYSDIWKSLQALRLIGDDLWERATVDDIALFSNQIRITKKCIYDSELYLEEKDRNDLLQLMRAFGYFRVGKRNLLDIRNSYDVLRSVLLAYASYKDDVDDPDQLPLNIQMRVQEQIRFNQEYKVAYEELLERVRLSFYNKLLQLSD